MFYHIQLNCIPRSGSHLLLSHLFPRGYVELSNMPSKELKRYKGLCVIHNHVPEGINLRRFPDNKQVVNVILKRNYFMSAISLLVAEYTKQYNWATYTDNNFEKIYIPDYRIEQMMLGHVETIKTWKKFKHPRIARTVILDYDDLVNNRWTSVYNKLGIVHEPKHIGVDGLGTPFDLVVKSPNKSSIIVSNYKELKNRYKHFLT